MGGSCQGSGRAEHPTRNLPRWCVARGVLGYREASRCGFSRSVASSTHISSIRLDEGRPGSRPEGIFLLSDRAVTSLGQLRTNLWPLQFLGSETAAIRDQERMPYRPFVPEVLTNQLADLPPFLRRLPNLRSFASAQNPLLYSPWFLAPLFPGRKSPPLPPPEMALPPCRDKGRVLLSPAHLHQVLVPPPVSRNNPPKTPHILPLPPFFHSPQLFHVPEPEPSAIPKQRSLHCRVGVPATGDIRRHSSAVARSARVVNGE